MAETKIEQTGPEFAIQRIYTKDLSFEAPSTPHVFQQEWKPVVDMHLDNRHVDLGEGHYEVVLVVNITTKIDEKTIFVAELQQAGIFTLGGFSTQQLDEMIGSFCPNILFPYAREALTDVVVRGGFPPLYLAPVNFDALYAEQQKAAENSDETVAASTH